MTATPKIYKEAAKTEAKDELDATVASMDNDETFGPEFHRLGFGEAVERGLLADYKVLILTVDEAQISKSFQGLMSSHGALNIPEIAKIVGCLSGLGKLSAADGGGAFRGTEDPMRRAVAFWSSIEESQRFAEHFDLVSKSYNEQREREANMAGRPRPRQVTVPTRHVDGSHNIRDRRIDIRWLKDNPPENECRVLSNVRCLTEGVDVPALDAVMFLTPRRSRIDIVQAVGRVMRKPPGKNIGYVILPIAIPAGQDPATALDKSKDYDVVWEVLRALRAHDERFNAYINRLALREDPKAPPEPQDPIQIGNATPITWEADKDPTDVDDDNEAAEPVVEPQPLPVQQSLFQFEEWATAIYTKVVTKVGSRTYWDDWAKDVAAIAARHETRIEAILNQVPSVTVAFDEFLAGLHANLNESISSEDAISMLSQHLITRPIFEALFGSDSFSANNPVSQAMQQMVDLLDEHHLETETESLEKFYDSVRRRVEGIPQTDYRSRQHIVKELYGTFFTVAFPKVSASLGIVYTPIEVVDFIIRATEAALNEHFGASLADKGVHVLDPFTGTGTFITRLLQSGFIGIEDLPRKYASEIHANELLLLAYYIAAVNIEAAYHQRLGAAASEYTPFPGVVLTDTFQLGETGDGTAFDVFPVNNERVKRQRGLDIRVILGNPPYSAGQSSTNDNNANLSYPNLDESISASYAALSTAKLKNSLYDSYFRALRWGSNRVHASKHGGIVAFVTNGGYIDGNTADGFRLSVAREFHHVYVFNLRGNQRSAGEQSRREGGKIFDSGSRTTVAIILLVKKPGDVPGGGATLHYRDIGEYLTREAKLNLLNDTLLPQSTGPAKMADVGWLVLQPNSHGDWIGHRTELFADLLPLEGPGQSSIFLVVTSGLKTGRDAWNNNSSRIQLGLNTTRMIAYFNKIADEFDKSELAATTSQALRTEVAKTFVSDRDPTQFSWIHSDFQRMGRKDRYRAEDAEVMVGTYRPFHRRFVNVGPRLNDRIAQQRKMFPKVDSDNLVISVSGMGGGSAPFSALMTRDTPDQNLAGAGNAVHVIPQYLYSEVSQATDGLFEFEAAGPSHNVSEKMLMSFSILDSAIAPDDIFFYVYGVLHSSEYRTLFANDLRKALPRIPKVDSPSVFWQLSSAGRRLSVLHTEYEEVEPWPDLSIVRISSFQEHPDFYRVKKMAYRKLPGLKGRASLDLSSISFNDHITISGIPLRAHEYMLGSRSAMDWVLESFQIKKHKESGIVNDPNDWATEHNDPTYIFDLVRRVVTVSMRTLDIVDGLPSLNLR
jgi:predicted helicase